MMKLGFVFLLALATPAWALDADMEQRCKDVDALGAPNACVCSEPMIASGTWTPGFWDPPGSTTKPCGADGGVGKALYIKPGNALAGTGIVKPSSWYTVPAGSGIPNVFLLNSNGGNAPNRFAGRLEVFSQSVPANVGRVCHRAMFILSPDFVGKNDETIPPLPNWCTGTKTVEFNPAPDNWGKQFQGGWDSAIHCTGTNCGGADRIYWNGQGGTGSPFFTGSTFQMDECKSNWCAIEQCWYGNFATGAIQPVVRRYAVNMSGSVVIDRTSTWLGSLVSNAATPVKFGIDWMLNLYKQDMCPGSIAFGYGMEAFFATADDGTAAHGPWIGPPSEFTGGGGGGGGGQTLGVPGKPVLVP